MASATGLGEVRTSAPRREEGMGAIAARTSIREVCLLGMEVARPVPDAPTTPEGAWDAGGRLRWSGRSYRVEATQVRTATAGTSGAPLRYVHLAPLVEG